MRIVPSVRSLALGSAVAVSLALAAPAAAADAFTGCLAQEDAPPNFYRLDHAKRGDEALGDVRLTGSLSGIDPAQELGSEVRVRGTLRESDGAKQIRVQSANVIGGDCT